jgi:hypothetical protein
VNERANGELNVLAVAGAELGGHFEYELGNGNGTIRRARQITLHLLDRRPLACPIKCRERGFKQPPMFLGPCGWRVSGLSPCV